MSDQRFARAVAEAFADEVLRHRALAPSLTRAAVAFRVRGADGAFSSCTCVLDDRAQVLDGELAPPGFPVVRVTADAGGLAELFAGRTDAPTLASQGRLALEGPEDLLRALTACFSIGANPISIRFAR